MSVKITFPKTEEEQQRNKANYDYIRDNLIRPGSIVTPKTFIPFTDGKVHLPGYSYHVTEETISYYVVNFNSYLVEKY